MHLKILILNSVCKSSNNTSKGPKRFLQRTSKIGSNRTKDLPLVLTNTFRLSSFNSNNNAMP